MFDEIKRDLQSIDDDLFAIGTMPLNADNISIQMAFDKHWGSIAREAKETIISLENLLKKDVSCTEISLRSIAPYVVRIKRQDDIISDLQFKNNRLQEQVYTYKPSSGLTDSLLTIIEQQYDEINELKKQIEGGKQ
jgi:hypothetical protein